MLRFALLPVGLLAALGAAGCVAGEAVRARLRLVDGAAFELSGIDPAARPWSEMFVVRVASAGADAPAVLGSYAVRGDRVRFTPTFPLAAGVGYRIEVDGARLGLGGPLRRTIVVPAPTAPPVRVERIYPSASVLPANLLRFYVQFSGPVGRGQVYRHLTLRDDTAGALVDLPFLEIAEELWDRTGTRLTLLIDPGRIKSELRPRVEAGPVFRTGHRYTLALGAACRDADGRPLGGGFEKRFRIGPADTSRPDPTRWQLAPPRAGRRGVLVVRFPEPLDHALLQHMIQVVGPGGATLAGAVEVTTEESVWRFRPEAPWPAGGHRLRIDAELEDRAGNSIRAPFEVDVFGTAQRRLERRYVWLPFTPTGA